MTPARLVASLLFTAIAACASAVSIADFNSGVPANVQRNLDKKVTSASLSPTRNPLDNSGAVEFSADLTGWEAGWAGLTIPVDRSTLTSETETVRFSARALANTRELHITLTEADTSRWDANVAVGPEWNRFSIPNYRFVYFSGPEARRTTSPRFSEIVAVDAWVSSKWQGANGFALDDLAIADDVPRLTLHLASSTSVPLQQHTTVTLEARETTGGPVVSFTGDIWLGADYRERANFPERVTMRDGRAEFDLFVRSPQELNLFAYEPHNAIETRVGLIPFPGALFTQIELDRFEGQPQVMANVNLAARVRAEGSTVPLSVHFEAADHTGRVVMARNFPAADAIAGRALISFSMAGLFSFRASLLADPIENLPRLQNNVPEKAEVGKPYPSQFDTLPDGVTSTVVALDLVRLEHLPTTATVIGHDEFSLPVFTLSARENLLYNAPFGISSGALLHLPPDQIPTLGRTRLRWHRRLGSFWARNDLWWNVTQQDPDSFDWSRLDAVVGEYRHNRLNILGMLGYGPSWSDGKAPATTESLGQWRSWASQLFDRYASKLSAYEVWNEPNTALWKPKPDPLAYRELVKTTYEALRTSRTTHRIIAGATAGFDPVFTEIMLSDGYAKYAEDVSFHPYPDRPNESPEANLLPEQCVALREIMTRYGAGSRNIWISEIGWPTGPFGVTEKEQANYLARVYAIALSNRVSKVFWFNLCDWESLPWRGGKDAHLGLLDSRLQLKPAATAYNLLEFMLAQLTHTSTAQHGKAVVHSYSIQTHSYKWQGAMHVAWTPHAGDSETVELPIGAGGGVFAFDYLGAQQFPELVGSKNDDTATTKTYRFRITDEPLYIWDMGVAPKKNKK